MKKLELKGKEKTELENLLAKEQNELLELKMQNATNKLKNPRQITVKRKEIARIHTYITEKESKV